MSSKRIVRSLCAPLLALFLLAGCQFFQKDAASFSGKKYAVVIGINDYINISNDLQYCVSDAESVAQMLIDGGWNKSSINKIQAQSNEAVLRIATKNNIRTALQNVPADVDTFFFYYSGHGEGGTEAENAYLVPSDYNGSSSSMISSAELSSWLDTIPARNKMVIIDACYSGGFVDPREALDAVPGDYQKNSLLKGQQSGLAMFLQFGTLLAKNSLARSGSTGYSTAPLVISAAGWKELSWEQGEKGIGNGVFTKYLLEAASLDGSFMKGDADGDQVLTCLEAYRYAAARLQENWNTGSSQDFLPHISGGLRDFALIERRSF